MPSLETHQPFDPDHFKTGFHDAVGGNILPQPDIIPPAAMSLLIDTILEYPSKTEQIIASAKGIVNDINQRFLEPRASETSRLRPIIHRMVDTHIGDPPKFDVRGFEVAVIAALA